jgi:hypothetical protein
MYRVNGIERDNKAALEQNHHRQFYLNPATIPTHLSYALKTKTTKPPLDVG